MDDRCVIFVDTDEEEDANERDKNDDDESLPSVLLLEPPILTVLVAVVVVFVLENARMVFRKGRTSFSCSPSFESLLSSTLSSSLSFLRNNADARPAEDSNGKEEDIELPFCFAFKRRRRTTNASADLIMCSSC